MSKPVFIQSTDLDGKPFVVNVSRVEVVHTDHNADGPFTKLSMISNYDYDSEESVLTIQKKIDSALGSVED